MTNPVPNIALLDRVREHIGLHPEQHDQDAWALETACGTTYCFAGWTCVLSGIGADFSRAVDEQWGRETAMTVDGVSIPGKACYLLGLTYGEAEKLFHSASILDIDRRLSEIKARAASLAAPELVAEAEKITAAAQLVSA